MISENWFVVSKNSWKSQGIVLYPDNWKLRYLVYIKRVEVDPLVPI